MFTGLGHEVELLPVAQVRPFVRSHKDDAADARAIWRRSTATSDECPRRAWSSSAGAAPHEIALRRAHGDGELLRGLLYEFGVVLRRTRGRLKALGEQRAVIDEQLPAAMRVLVDGQLEDARKKSAGASTNSRVRSRRCVPKPARARSTRCPASVLGSTALAATLGDEGVALGAEFSASLGLVPAHAGTGGKVRVGHLSKRGDLHRARCSFTGRWLGDRARQGQAEVARRVAGAPAQERGGGGAGQQDGTARPGSSPTAGRYHGIGRALKPGSGCAKAAAA
ncbi:MAG: hypothetical protein U1E86_03500 [Burkholderiaceae bacterium]